MIVISNSGVEGTAVDAAAVMLRRVNVILSGGENKLVLLC